jgi:hypothetical protein
MMKPGIFKIGGDYSDIIYKRLLSKKEKKEKQKSSKSLLPLKATDDEKKVSAMIRGAGVKQEVGDKAAQKAQVSISEAIKQGQKKA